MILIAQVIIVLLISIYLTQVIPTEFGTARPWHYPISAFWKTPVPDGKVDIEDLEDCEDGDVREERERVYNREYSPDAPLILKQMSKTYNSNGNIKQAVKNISFAVDTGVVFGLLGPNGAGKTSLISVLTGIHEATSGESRLAGFDLKSQPEYALRSIGVCPQFDILWDELTVEEHLYFYARLKRSARAHV